MRSWQCSGCLRLGDHPFQYLSQDAAERAFQTHDAETTTSHQRAFDLPHAARQDQHSYIPYWSNLVKNVPVASVRQQWKHRFGQGQSLLLDRPERLHVETTTGILFASVG